MVSVTGASIQNNECVWQTRIVGLLVMSIMMAAKTERERERERGGGGEKGEGERERERRVEGSRERQLPRIKMAISVKL